MNTSSLQGVSVSTHLTTQKEIAKRAFELWKIRGRPPGSIDQFWIQAEEELNNSIQPSTKAGINALGGGAGSF